VPPLKVLEYNWKMGTLAVSVSSSLGCILFCQFCKCAVLAFGATLLMSSVVLSSVHIQCVKSAFHLLFLNCLFRC
jgi:dolichol kinase